MAIPIPYADSVETIPSDEAKDIDRVIEVLRDLLSQHFQKSGSFQRDVHVKSHGGAQAQFQVLSGLPPELSQGLFARPHTYPAVVRFSNSAPWAQSDALPDGRGLAVQVADVQRETTGLMTPGALTQDFIMVNHPVFIARDVKEYLRMEEARLQTADQPVLLAGAMLSGPLNPFTGHWREAIATARVAAQLPTHPASYTYYSMVPIRFGEYVAKYRVVPSLPGLVSAVQIAARFATEKDAMRELLQETLLKQEIAFDFQVQLRTSEDSMPIEDATIEWPENESPYATVAQLTLPSQDLSQGQAEYERLAFSVWNALLDHRPLGGINRSRRFAYAVSADYRNQQAAGT